MAGKKVALVTGANKGIGKEIARQLGALGMTVLIGARDKKRGEEAAAEIASGGADVHALLVDVTDQAGIDAAAAQVERGYGRLDVLVNNAGVDLDLGGAVRLLPPSQLTMDTLRQTYETNVFGVFAVTKAFLPLIKKSDAGWIVNMSSGLGSLAQQSDPNYAAAFAKALAYPSSKAALNMMTVQFAYELKDTSIKVNSADPGFTATDLNEHRGTRTVAQAAAVAVHLATLPADGPTGGYFDEDGGVPW